MPRHDIIASVARLSFTTVAAETFLSLISSPKSAYAAVILSKSTKFSFFSFILKSLPFLEKVEDIAPVSNVNAAATTVIAFELPFSTFTSDTDIPRFFAAVIAPSKPSFAFSSSSLNTFIENAAGLSAPDE